MFDSMKTIYCFIAITVVESQEICPMSKCSKPMKLNSPSFSLDSTWKVDAKAKIYKIRREKPMVMIRIGRRSLYCSEIPFNEYDQCTTSITSVPISDVEAMLTSVRGTCKVGKECWPDSECWGSEAQECHSPIREQFVSPQKMAKSGPWFKIPYHTCSQNWECVIQHFEPKIQIKPGWKGTIITPIGEEITFELDKQLSTTPLNYTIIFNLMESPITDEVKAQCISHKERSICMIEYKENFLVEFDKNGECYMNDKMLKLIDHEEVAKHPVRKFADLLDDSPLTIGQARELQEQILYDNLQAHLNTKVLEKGIESLYKIVFETLTFLSKTNPLLMKNSLKLPGYTSDSENGVFIQCPCVFTEKETSCDTFREGGVSPSKRCLTKGEKASVYVNYTWASGLDWNSIPELTFYASSSYQTLMDDLRTKSILHTQSTEEREKTQQDLLDFYTSFTSGFFKKNAWIAAWLSLVLSVWLIHVWCTNAVRGLRD